MLQYIARRLLWMIPTMFGVTLVIFFLIDYFLLGANTARVYPRRLGAPVHSTARVYTRTYECLGESSRQ